MLFEMPPPDDVRGFRDRGVLLLPRPFLSADLFAGLVEEARRARKLARPYTGYSELSRSSQDTFRGPYGPIAETLVLSDELSRFVRAATGRPLRLQEIGCSFTYYEEGQYITRHCDRPRECVVALLLWLEAITPRGTSGSALLVYRTARARKPSWRIESQPNGGVLVRGSELPHERPPLSRGQRVTLLTACFGRRSR